MSFRFRRLQHILFFLPHIYSGTSYRLSGTGTNLLAACSTVLSCNIGTSIYRKLELVECQGKRCPNLLRTASSRCSTVSETKHNLFSAVDILSFIQSSLHEPESSFSCWMNTVADSKNLFKEDGTFLVLLGEDLDSHCTSAQHLVKMFEKAKSLQQRYPFLQVLTVLYCRKSCLNDVSIRMLERIIKEYVTFPILLTDKNILEMANGPCYIISKGFQDPSVYPEKDVDLKVLDKAILELNAQNMEGVNVHDPKSTWVKPIEFVKEPTVCSASRNLLSAYPGCVSVDDSSSRLFLSDVNHHRIIVFSSTGKILDAIGSNPGFEDGEFENAKLMRPAASFYKASEDSLYFLDSENHAIRRADMERRVVATVFPATDGGKTNKSLWKWIMDKIWTKKNKEPKPDELNSESFLFPWHLLKSPDNDLFILSKSFGTLWIVDLELGLIKEVVKESSKILEICGKMITEKSMPLKQLPADFLQQQINSDCSVEGIQYAALISSAATFQDNIVFCDTVGQMVLQFSKGTGSLTSLQFSNFGVLGLPYWLSFPLERVCTANDVISRIDVNHSQNFRLLPGRIDIDINVKIPQNTDLAEPLQEECIWRQARGAAAEVSGIENKAASTEKVGVAQQWYDEIDNLAFTTTQDETNIEEEITPKGDEVQDNTVRIQCTINTSPGSSEVIIYAALYLRLKKNADIPDDSREKKAARLANILDPKRSLREDDLVKLLTRTNRDLEELIFVKPLHIRLKFNTLNHPKADNSKDIILTDSSVKVDVNL